MAGKGKDSAGAVVEQMARFNRMLHSQADSSCATSPDSGNIISEMGRAMFGFHRAFQAVTGLSGAQWRILALLLEQESDGIAEGQMESELQRKVEAETSFMQQWKQRQQGLSQRRVQEMLGVDAAGITRTAKQLEQDGWIRRESDPNDNRYTLIYLTEQGRKLQEEVPHKVTELWRLACTGMERTEVEQLREGLRRLADNLAAIEDEEAAD